MGNLPSRAADNLFWLGRYLERAEATLRLIRALCTSLMDSDAAVHSAGETRAKLQDLLVEWGAVEGPAEGEEASGKVGDAASAARRRGLRGGVPVGEAEGGRARAERSRRVLWGEGV